VVTRTFALVCGGLLAGFGAAVAFSRAVRALLFQVSATDHSAMIVPLAALAVAAACAVLPPVVRATRIDPAQTLRTA
jgi:hypothetical protein